LPRQLQTPEVSNKIVNKLTVLKLQGRKIRDKNTISVPSRLQSVTAVGIYCYWFILLGEQRYVCVNGGSLCDRGMADD